MTKKIWNAGEEKGEIRTPFEILFDYAQRVKEDTEGRIEGVVTENISDSSVEVVYALYLVVPELRNYSYRLIEVTQQNAFTPYPVIMRLFGTVAGNVVELLDVPYERFDKELLKLIDNPLTKIIIQGLYTHIEIKRKYQR
jgi:hypothetical protein